jgi:hypothetical protein
MFQFTCSVPLKAMTASLLVVLRYSQACRGQYNRCQWGMYKVANHHQGMLLLLLLKTIALLVNTFNRATAVE